MTSIQHTIKILLQRYGRTFAEDLGIPAEQNQPSPLYCLLISAALWSRLSRLGARHRKRAFRLAPLLRL